MVQLQRDSDKFTKANLQLVGVSPDSVDKLKQFSAQKKISFPLLSDKDGAVIKGLGVQNKDSKRFLPHPGILLVGTDGVVRGKLFKESHRTRHENAAILKAAEALGQKLNATAGSAKKKELVPAG